MQDESAAVLLCGFALGLFCATLALRAYQRGRESGVDLAISHTDAFLRGRRAARAAAQAHG